MVYLTDILSIELHQLQRKCFLLSCSFAFLNSQGYPLVWKEKCKRFSVSSEGGFSIIFQDFIRMDDIFGSRRNAFLPNDILTIQCRMWDNSNELFIEPLSLFARTRIEPRIKVLKSFTWDVPDAISFSTQWLEHVETIAINGESLTMKLLLGIDDIDFKVKITVSLFGIHLNLTISVLDISGRKVQFVNGEFQFNKSDQEWNLGTHITKNLLRCYRNSLLHNDTLTLHFSCILSANVTFNGLEDENEIVNVQQPIVNAGPFSEPNECQNLEIETPKRLDPSDTASQALQDMFTEGFLSDFSFKVGDKVFPIHRAVLGVRSRVFRAMFTTDMKENEDNCVAIEDVDENTLERLLQFVYSDRMDEDMDLVSVCSLYEAADKYALDGLQHKCSTILKFRLCSLRVLTLADMHQDQELKSAALDFILQNDKDIVGSERWNRFEEENKPLAFDTFRNLYFKKMNG